VGNFALMFGDPCWLACTRWHRSHPPCDSKSEDASHSHSYCCARA